jgi:hypothetical protein
LFDELLNVGEYPSVFARCPIEASYSGDDERLACTGGELKHGVDPLP